LRGEARAMLRVHWIAWTGNGNLGLKDSIFVHSF
jgi:hypothetical protein